MKLRAHMRCPPSGANQSAPPLNMRFMYAVYSGGTFLRGFTQEAWA